MSKYIKVALFLIFCLLHQNILLSTFDQTYLDQLQRSPLIIAFSNFEFHLVCREYDDNNTEEEALMAFGLAANLTRSDDNEWSEPC